MKRTRLNRKTPLRAKPKRASAEYTAAKKEIFAASNGACQAHIEGVCVGPAHHAHHLLRRSQGGTDEPSNLLPVCFSCHDWIHTHPAEAREKGLLQSARVGNGREGVWIVEYNEKPWTHNAERRMNMHVRGKIVKQWRTDFCLLAKHQKIPRLMSAQISVVPYQKRGKLQDVAACAPAAKAAIDGLVDAGVLPDDSSKFVTAIEFCAPERGDDKLVLVIVGVKEKP